MRQTSHVITSCLERYAAEVFTNLRSIERKQANDSE